MFWPLDFLEDMEFHNVLNIDMEGKIPLEKFSGVQINVGIKHFHNCCCPVYVLEYKLQYGKVKLSNWDPRTRAGIYLGHSAVHANLVALVLNPKTGHFSPQ